MIRHENIGTNCLCYTEVNKTISPIQTEILIKEVIAFPKLSGAEAGLNANAKGECLLASFAYSPESDHVMRPSWGNR